MRQWTILGIHIDVNKKEFYLQNWGWTEEELVRCLCNDKKDREKFKETYINGFEKDITNNELKLLLETCISNYTILGVYDITNSYNRDQKAINMIKSNERARWISKGYVEVEHCTTLDDDDIKLCSNIEDIINKRNYLHILADNISNTKDELNSIKRKAKITRDNLERENTELKNEITANTERIKRQNNYIKETENIKQEYQQLKKEFDNLIERYKNGERYCEEQERNLMNRNSDKLKELENKVIDKTRELTELEKNVKELNIKVEELKRDCDYYDNIKKKIYADVDEFYNMFNIDELKNI